jgi:hypothetical protein
MSRYRGPKLRITRRLGVLPGLTTKSHKTNRPGKDGNLVEIQKNWRCSFRREAKVEI